MNSQKNSHIWIEVKLEPEEHLEEIQHICTICLKSFTQKLNLKIHLLVAHCEEKCITCPICKKKYDKVRFCSHLEIHSIDKPFICRICHMKFCFEENLNRHMRMLTCRVCQMHFSDKENFDKHIRIHCDEKSKKCLICPKRYKNLNNLMKHIRLHPEKKPNKRHVCSTCGKEFTEKRCLIDHLNDHSGTQYKCPSCGKIFNRTRSLNEHVRRIHESENSFICETCEKRFPRKNELIKHIKIHSDLKPFNCDSCTKSFKHRTDLLRHVQIHSPGEPFTCKICLKLFAVKRYLVRHLKTHLVGKARTSVNHSQQQIDNNLPSPATKIYKIEKCTSEESFDATVKTEPEDVESACVNLCDDIFIKSEDNNLT